MSTLEERLGAVCDDISSAATRAGRALAEVALVAVSKTHPPEAVAEAFRAGQGLFGESRVQEARVKIPLSPTRARWHFIGHLQKNKIRQSLPLFEMLHSIDSAELAQDIDRIAAELGLFPRVLLEVNVAGEASKYGFTPAGLRATLEEMLTLERVQVEGLMAVPPFAPEPEASRPYFVKLRELRDALASEFGVPLPQLSMGMSGDYVVAVEEGATIIRVGSAIFGPRPKAAKRDAMPEA